MNAENTLSLSIAIVCYHTRTEELESLLISIKKATEVLNEGETTALVEVTLVDNSETPAITFELLDRFKVRFGEARIGLSLKQGHGNIGYGRANNLVALSSASDFHLVLNPDVVLGADSLLRGIKYLVENPTVVMVSPKGYGLNRSRQYLCKRYPSVLTLLIRGFLPKKSQQHFRQRLDNYEMRDLDFADDCKEKLGDIEIISGCFMLCRTDALKKIGGFDSRYFLYFEDFDLSLRMLKLGKIVYLPEMKIVHGGGNAVKKGWRHILMFIWSGIKFYNTHGWRWLKQ